MIINELIQKDVTVIDKAYCITDMNGTMLNKLGHVSATSDEFKRLKKETPKKDRMSGP